ncbi:hypothetical protein [Micromonospora sp. CA-246542]|uniref:hypothetical protein n=1 Tax=Micromonospora sp. CA-246542 TaxID=3239959 RepID=UPI003D92221A
MGSRTQLQPRAGTEEPHGDGEMIDPGEHVITRITVGIIPKAWTDLQKLIARTRFNRTDVVNRAISIYAMVDENTRNGNELVFRDPKTGKERIVEIV